MGNLISFELNDGDEYTFNHTDFNDIQGIGGQSNINPASIFSNHQFCNINEEYFDAAYGKKHDLLSFDSDVIAGWGYQSNYLIQESHYNKDLNGNGAIDLGSVEIIGIFVDPVNASNFGLPYWLNDY